MTEKPKCDEIGFKHLWMYGDNKHVRTCENCGRRERQRIDWVEHPYDHNDGLPHGHTLPADTAMRLPMWKDR
jgi:hypothetical protein